MALQESKSQESTSWHPRQSQACLNCLYRYPVKKTMPGVAGKLTRTNCRRRLYKFGGCNKHLWVKSRWTGRNMNHPARQRSDAWLLRNQGV